MHDQTTQHFYGAATVGERGQVVIPQQAREAMGIKAGDKLLVLGGPFGDHGVIMIKAEALSEFISKMTAKFSNLEKMLQTPPEE